MNNDLLLIEKEIKGCVNVSILETIRGHEDLVGLDDAQRQQNCQCKSDQNSFHTKNFLS